MPDVRGFLLPIYVLVDESISMKDDLDELDQGLASLHAELIGQPMAAAKVRITVLGFSNDVQERVHLADLREVTEMPTLHARGNTNYESAFQDLLQRIPADVVNLKAQGYGLYRPTVFFLSDGQPNAGNWEGVHRQLVDRSAQGWAPNIIACGIGQANPHTILQVATNERYAFVAIQGAQLGPSIGAFCSELTQSIVKSALGAAGTTPPQVQFQPAGFQLVMDVI